MIKGVLNIRTLSFIIFSLFLTSFTTKNGSGTEIIFSQNLFRCITPARMTRFEKSLIQAHFQISQLLTK